jgi:prepilin-type processing-associated H-X9-DG protein
LGRLYLNYNTGEYNSKGDAVSKATDIDNFINKGRAQLYACPSERRDHPVSGKGASYAYMIEGDDGVPGWYGRCYGINGRFMYFNGNYTSTGRYKWIESLRGIPKASMVRKTSKLIYFMDTNFLRSGGHTTVAESGVYYFLPFKKHKNNTTALYFDGHVKNNRWFSLKGYKDGPEGVDTWVINGHNWESR